MKVKKIGILALCISVLGVLWYIFSESSPTLQRKKHHHFLDNSPFKYTQHLIKKERKQRGLPPNPYYERLWELMMDPSTGRPHPERIMKLQDQWYKEINESKNNPLGVVNAPAINDWTYKGPKSVAGRTRSLLFDPNDPSKKRVFAGGVGGGLWVNDDITNADSSWRLVQNVPGNLNVSCMTYDPNNPKIMFLGTGALFDGQPSAGNGIYKSVDGGKTWKHSFGSFGGKSVEQSKQIIVPGHYFIQDIVAWNDGGKTQIFATVCNRYQLKSAAYKKTFYGFGHQYGLYKSTDSGREWKKINTPLTNKRRNFQLIDIEIASDNSIWVSSANNYYGDLGGAIFKSTDGIKFEKITQIPNLYRTEIEPSSQNPNKFYVLAHNSISRMPVFYVTNDAFKTYKPLTLPIDRDIRGADKFANNQAHFNLVVEADPTDDNIVYLGAINLFKSTDGGKNFEQISSSKVAKKSYVHVDQHIMVFHPTRSNEAIFGNDGGVYWTNYLDRASYDSPSVIKSRNKDYGVTQFLYLCHKF